MEWVKDYEKDLEGNTANVGSVIYFFKTSVSKDKKLEMCIKQVTEIHHNYGLGLSLPSQNSLNTLYQNLDNIYGIVTSPKYVIMYIENNKVLSKNFDTKIYNGFNNDPKLFYTLVDNNHVRYSSFTHEEMEKHFPNSPYSYIYKINQRNENIDKLLKE
jgi:hypothetical protein